jgi:hypothetical protein
MRKMELKSDCVNGAGCAGRTLRNFALWIFVVLGLGLIGTGGPAADADVAKAPIATARPGLSFAVADFDGDLHPDLASVQSGPNNSGSTNYRIQLHLSTIGQRSIQLVAPTGGLFIEARDVNGDHAIDLVLTTAWFRQPVAIYLNDGHGGFSRAEQDTFPGAFSESNTNWTSTASAPTGAVGIPPQSGASIWSAETDSRNDRSPQRLIPSSSAAFPGNAVFISPPGRAPPSEVFQR